MEQGYSSESGVGAVADGAFATSSMEYNDSLYSDYLQEKIQKNLQLLEGSVPQDLLTSPEVY